MVNAAPEDEMVIGAAAYVETVGLGKLQSISIYRAEGHGRELAGLDNCVARVEGLPRHAGRSKGDGWAPAEQFFYRIAQVRGMPGEQLSLLRIDKQAKDRIRDLGARQKRSVEEERRREPGKLGLGQLLSPRHGHELSVDPAPALHANVIYHITHRTMQGDFGVVDLGRREPRAA